MTFHKHHFHPIVEGLYLTQKGERELQAIRDGVLEVCFCPDGKRFYRIPGGVPTEARLMTKEELKDLERGE